MYTILDIETTGGKYNEEGITEIAIYKFDGHTVVDQFISLVNPEKEIQPFVVNLTGISNNMLKHAPKFYEVAKRIVEITQNTVIVAHNAKFDYRMLRTEFHRLGYAFTRETLCTVELAKKLIPDLPSYSLGKLARNLGIPVSSRHRASGDAMATVKLFQLLLEKDVQKNIVKQAIKLEPKTQLEPKLIAILNSLPTKTGVYYMHNNKGEIIYIGKSKNIKKRINQHFTSTTAKAKKIQLQVATVTYEICGSELVALLKESEAIKQNKPIFNRALRRTIFTHALYQFIDENGYINLKIDKADGRKNAITTFSNRQSAKNNLHKWVEQYQLCQKLVGLYPTLTSCFNYEVKNCLGACIQKETPNAYNQRVQQLINKNSFKNKSFIILDQGKYPEEKSAIVIKNGIFKGITYFHLNFQINNFDILESLITPMQNNRDTQHIIKNYLRKNKNLKIISIETAQ